MTTMSNEKLNLYREMCPYDAMGDFSVFIKSSKKNEDITVQKHVLTVETKAAQK